MSNKNFPWFAGAFQAQVLITDPLVAITATRSNLPLGPVPCIAARVGDRECWWLIVIHWTIEIEDRHTPIVAAYRAFAANYSRHQILYLCNTERERELLASAGVPAIFCNHNVLVSERLYVPDAGKTKEYDAVYTARMLPYKRHALGCVIPSLALIYYDVESAEPGYFDTVREALPNAVFVNEVLAKAGYGQLANSRAQALAAQLFAKRNFVALRPEKVSEVLNRARVGLCLSAAEGAMYASMEYLLCGLPVVSTENYGGRDEFFDAEYCRTVPPDPYVVAAAVAELADRNIAAARVRESTLARVGAMRDRLRLHVASMVGRASRAERLEAAFDQLFSGRWWRWYELDELCAAAQSAPR